MMVSPTPLAQSSSFCPKAVISRLLAYLRLLPHLDSSLKGANLSSRTSDVHNPPSPPISEFDQWFPADPDALRELIVEFVLQLRPLLPDDCDWLEDGAIQFDNGHPVDAGGFADILVGMIESKKVAVKYFRIYSSSDYFLTFMVNDLDSLSSLSY